MGQTEGFVKLISHNQTDRVLGVHIIGARAADMIAECVLAVEFGAAAKTSPGRSTDTRPSPRRLMEAAMAASGH